MKTVIKTLITLTLTLLLATCIIGCNKNQEEDSQTIIPQTLISYCDLEYDNDIVYIAEKHKGSSSYRGEYFYNDGGKLSYINLYLCYTNILEYKLEYNESGLLEKYTDYSGIIAKYIRVYEYDENSTLAKCSFYDIDALEYYVTYEYDSNGYLLKRKTHTNDILNSYIAYTYDTDGKLLSAVTYSLSEDGTSFSETNKTLYTYDTQSRIISETVYRGEQVTKKDEYDYSGVNTKITSYTSYNAEGILELSCFYEINEEGKLINQEFPRGGNHTNTFDENGILISEENLFNNSVVCVEREFDDKYNLINISFIVDEKPGFAIKYTYDENDIIISSEIIDLNGETIVQKDQYVRISWEYSTDSNKNLHEISYRIQQRVRRFFCFFLQSRNRNITKAYGIRCRQHRKL